MARDAALKLIQETLEHLKEELLIFASPEDAQYFRMHARKKGAERAPAHKIAAETIKAPAIQKPIPAAPTPAPIEKPAPEPIALKPIPPQPEIASMPEKSAEAPKQGDAPQKPAWRQEALKAPLASGFEGWRTLIGKIAPEVSFIEEIPSDADAKKIAARWKTKNQIAPISVLSFGEPDLQRELLAEIANALDVCFGPARLIQAEAIEQEKQWEAFLSADGLKFVIVCDYSLWQLKGLMPFYKEISSQGMRNLGNVPLFLLPDLSLYLKDPLLKRSLWKALCQKLSS